MDNKIALEEHLSTAENNNLWDSAGESSRNGKAYTEYIESHLVDIDERLKIMDATGIERTILSLTSPGIQSITDPDRAKEFAQRTNELVRNDFVAKHPDRFSMFACL